MDEPRKPDDAASIAQKYGCRALAQLTRLEPFRRDDVIGKKEWDPPEQAREPGKITATRFAWTDPWSIPPRQWLYGRHYIRGFLGSTVAPGGAYKSSLLQVEALAMVTGRDLLGFMPERPYRVWYWNGEDPLDEIDRRLVAACLHYGLKPDDLAGRLFRDSGRSTPIKIACVNKGDIEVASPVIQDVMETIRANRIDVVIIDPFVRCHKVPENDNGAINEVAEQWAAIADATDTAIEVAHHVRKTGGAPITADDSRGAVALNNAARSVRVLNTMSEDEAAKAGVEDRRFHFRADTGKANLAPPEKTTWFRARSVVLPNGPNRTDGDNVGVVTPWSWPSPFEGLTSADLLRVQQTIQDGEWRYNAQSPEWAGHAVGKALDINVDDAAGAAKVKGLLKTWIANGALKVVEKPDPTRHPKKFVEVGEWATD